MRPVSNERPRPGRAVSSVEALRRDVLRAAEIRLDIVTPRHERGPVVEAAYALWHAVWLSTFRELDGIEQLDSNEFTRQDEILVLTHRDRCIAVTGLRHLDRSSRIDREDSYFRPWPVEALERTGGAFMVSSNTVVAETVRRARVSSDGDESLRLSELVIALALRRFVASPFTELVGVARNGRKMDNVGAALGGRAIGRVVIHGEESDIVLFSRFTLPRFRPAVEDIWRRCPLPGNGDR